MKADSRNASIASMTKGPYNSTTIRRLAGRIKRRLLWKWRFRSIPKKDFLLFRCNICGKASQYPAQAFTREEPSCIYCHSSLRFRSIIYSLSLQLFGKSLALADFPVRKDIRGIGLSDWEGYAGILAEKFDYTNTFYHCEPYLDISNPDPSQFGKCDFIISSDVFEHVPPPITKAFEGARKLLKPGGILIFSVPYISGVTQEHFPRLHKFSVCEEQGRWLIRNETSDGKIEEYSDVIFHGGPGSTVEMRLFGEDSLKKIFYESGFEVSVIHNENVPEQGIIWNSYDPAKAPYRPMIYGLDTPPWVAKSAK